MKKHLAILAVIISLLAVFVVPLNDAEAATVATDETDTFTFNTYINKSGELYASGSNLYGQLGQGNNGDTSYSDYIKIASNVSKVARGADSMYYITEGGNLYAAGADRGQFGRGQTPDGSTYEEVNTFTLIASNVKDVYLKMDGNQSVYGLLYIDKSNRLYASGYNGYGDLGLGTEPYFTTFTRVSSDVSQVSVSEIGGALTYITTSGQLYASGSSYIFGSDQYTPILIDSNVSKVVPSSDYLYYIKSGSLYVYDEGSKSSISSGVADVGAVGTTVYYLTNSGNLYGKGMNLKGELGTGDTNEVSSFELLASDVASFGYTGTLNPATIFITEGGNLYAAGSNTYGQMGDGSTNNVTEFRLVDSSVIDSVISSQTLTYLKSDGSIYASGYVYADGVSRSYTPTQVANINNPVTSIDITGPNSIYVGSSASFTITAYPSTATIRDVNISISGTAAEYNTVKTPSGAVVSMTGLNAGQMTITATAADGSGVSATKTLNVVILPVAQITITGPNSMQVGASSQLSISISPENATNPDVTWSADPADLVNIQEHDTYISIDAVKVGTVTITATAADGSGVSASHTINILANTVPVSSVVISGPDTVRIGSAISISAVTLPTTATERSVSWQIIEGVGNASITATETASGSTLRIEGLIDGDFVVKATALDGSGAYATKTITVESVEPLPPGGDDESGGPSFSFNTIVGVIGQGFFDGSTSLAGLAIMAVLFFVMVAFLANVRAPVTYALVPMMLLAIMFAALGIVDTTVSFLIIIICAVLVALSARNLVGGRS